jgi:hypothetical protein
MNDPEKPKIGLGNITGCGGLDHWQKSVYELLALGYPRLALARAQGIPFVPYYINVRTTFDNPDRNLNPEVGSDVKIVADTIIQSIDYTITRDRTPQNVFQPQSDYYFSLQSGIEAKINVVGMPRPSIAPKFTPLSTLAKSVGTSGHGFPHGIWVMTYQQQLLVDFLARVQLPDFPTTVVLTFKTLTPATDKFDGVNITDREALIRLRDMCGFCIPDCYVTACKS